jgi:hypothetical protein
MCLNAKIERNEKNLSKRSFSCQNPITIQVQRVLLARIFR